MERGQFISEAIEILTGDVRDDIVDFDMGSQSMGPLLRATPCNLVFIEQYTLTRRYCLTPRCLVSKA